MKQKLEEKKIATEMEELEDETELLETLSRAEPDRGEKGADGGTAEEIQPTGAEINRRGFLQSLRRGGRRRGYRASRNGKNEKAVPPLCAYTMSLHTTTSQHENKNAQRAGE